MPADETTTEEAQRKVFFDRSQAKEYLRAAKELEKSAKEDHKKETGDDARQVKVERGIAQGVDRIGTAIGFIPYVGAALKIPCMVGAWVLKGFAWLDDKRIRRSARQEEERKHKQVAELKRLAGKKHVQEKPPAHPGILAQIPVLSAILGQSPNPTSPIIGKRIDPRLFGILCVFGLALSLLAILAAFMLIGA